MPSIVDQEGLRLRREARQKAAELQAQAGAEGKAVYDAEIAARNANMERLKAERLARDASAAAAAVFPTKPRGTPHRAGSGAEPKP